MLKKVFGLACAILAGLAMTVAARAQQPAPVKMVWGYTNPSAYYWDVYAAIELGYLKDEGLAVEPLNISQVSQAVRTLLTGDINILSVNTEVAISAGEKDADIVMIGVETTKPTFALVARPEIADFAGLRGKTLGVTQLDEASTTMLKLLLQKNGVKPGEYDFVTTGGTPNRYAALKSGAIAATMLSQPVDFLAESEGFHVLGHAFEVFDGPLVSLATQRKWAKANPETVVRFLRATIRGSRFLHDPANREASIALLVRATKCTPDEARKSYDMFFGPLGIISVDLALSPEGVQKYIDLRGGKERAEKFLDATWLARALGR